MWTTMWTRAHTPYFISSVFTPSIVNKLCRVLFITIPKIGKLLFVIVFSIFRNTIISYLYYGKYDRFLFFLHYGI
jgi:hypothetical protein